MKSYLKNLAHQLADFPADLFFICFVRIGRLAFSFQAEAPPMRHLMEHECGEFLVCRYFYFRERSLSSQRIPPPLARYRLARDKKKHGPGTPDLSAKDTCSILFQSSTRLKGMHLYYEMSKPHAVHAHGTSFAHDNSTMARRYQEESWREILRRHQCKCGKYLVYRVLEAQIAWVGSEVSYLYDGFGIERHENDGKIPQRGSPE